MKCITTPTQLAILTVLAISVSGSNALGAIINSAIRAGNNRINDTDAFVFNDNDNDGEISVGDTYTEILKFDNITNSGFNQVDLDVAVGMVGSYELQAIVTNTVTAVAAGAIPGTVNFAFSTTGDVYENTVAGNFVDFSLSIAANIARITSGDLILSVATAGAAGAGLNDFGQAIGAPIAGTFPPTFLGITTGELGVTITANPGGVPIVTDGSGILYADAFGANFPAVPSFHDITATFSLFPLTTVSANYDGESDTTIQFTSDIPEPAALVVWGSLAALGLVVARKKVRNRSK